MGDLLNDATWPEVGAALAAVSALFAIGGWIVRKGLPFLRNMGHFFDDWFGEAPRPGVPARPGVPEQLATMREQVDEVVKEQQHVAQELRFNHGSSMKDAAHSTANTVAGMQGDIKQIAAAVETLSEAIGGKAVIEQASKLAAHHEGEEMWKAVADLAAANPPEE